VDEVLVDIIDLEFLEGGLESFFGVLDFCAADFGGYVQLISGNSRFFDSLAELGFVTVDCTKLIWLSKVGERKQTFCTIEMIVTGFNCHYHGLDELLVNG
jgi:hypothetical protein